MKLDVLERIGAIQLLSDYKQGDFITAKTLGGLRNKLFINEEEEKKYELKIVNGKYHWNELGNESTEIVLTEGETKLITDKLIQFDKEKRLLIPQHESLYEKFVLNK
jgi:hypothetical protein